MTKLETSQPVRPSLHPGEHPVGVRGLPPEYVLSALERFQTIVNERGVERKPGEKLPRATELRPNRFCVQDVVLSIWAMRHRKDEADIFVDVFLTSEVYNQNTGETGFYDEFSGATAAALTILSEAYRVGAPLRVSFGKSVEDGKVPLDILRLAARHGISIQDAEHGRISANEGRELYLALTGFRSPIRQAIHMLHQRGLMSPERAAYIVHHGVWSLPEVEGIILCSRYPDLVLSGDVPPEQRHLYQHVVTQSRLALMGGLLDRSLSKRNDGDASTQGKEPGLDAEDDERNLDIRTHARFLGREYVLLAGPVADQLPLPKWGSVSQTPLAPGERLSVLLRPRTSASLDAHLEKDISQAGLRWEQEPKPKCVALAVSFDFNDLPLARQQHFFQLSKEKSVILLICPESTRSLDQMAQKKMTASRIKKD